MEGWNDPPKNVGQPTGQLKINLNKRVAFPLGSAPPVASQETSSAMPPLLPPMSPPKAINLISRVSNSKIDENDTKPDDDKEQCLRAYCILKAAANRLDNPARDQVLTKLEAFNEDWKNCELDVKELLTEMTDYLEAEDFKNTAAVHRKIVLKGYNRPWIASVRQFTSMERLKEKNEEDLTTAIVNPLDIIPHEVENHENQ